MTLPIFRNNIEAIPITTRLYKFVRIFVADSDFSKDLLPKTIKSQIMYITSNPPQSPKVKLSLTCCSFPFTGLALFVGG